MERYAITVTFMPHLKYTERAKRIVKFKKIIRDELKLYHSYKLVYTIEYHKYPVKHPFAGQSNPMAPHIHAYLEVEGELQQKVINQLCREFRSRYGRTQFDQLHTPDDAQRWVDYCIKDVQDNNKKYGVEHYYEVAHELHKYEQQLESSSPENPYFSDSE